MAYLPCEVCGECMLGMKKEQISDKHQYCCKKCEHVYLRFMEQKEYADKQRRELEEIHDRGRALFAEIAEIMQKEGNTVEIPKDKLEQLWDALGLQYYDITKMRDFLSKCLIEGSVLCEAYGLFSKSDHRWGADTIIKKLEVLRESLEKCDNFHGWKHDSFTVNELIKRLKHEERR